jgi:hypothetical protein
MEKHHHPLRRHRRRDLSEQLNVLKLYRYPRKTENTEPRQWVGMQVTAGSASRITVSCRHYDPGSPPDDCPAAGMRRNATPHLAHRPVRLK